MRYMFIPWAPEEAGDLSPGKKRLNWSEVSNKTFTIVYLDDTNAKVFSFPDGGASVQIYVRGHGFKGGDRIVPENDKEHPKGVKYDNVCNMLIDKGLETNFSGKIKFYNCESHDGDGDNLSFACRCTSYLREKGYTKATYYGYTRPIIGHYRENNDTAVGNHKFIAPITPPLKIARHIARAHSNSGWSRTLVNGNKKMLRK